MFVAIYKAICCVFRNLNLAGGGESLLAGFIGTLISFAPSLKTKYFTPYICRFAEDFRRLLCFWR
jgi:hypothetical protein